MKKKTAELQALLEYTKPDIVCGTESWLYGVKPGITHSKDAIRSSEIFPSEYIAYRNDRLSNGGGVFILVHKNLVSVEQPDLVTDCELEWADEDFCERRRNSSTTVERSA